MTLTGAQVVTMAADRAMLEGITPGDRPHPVDRTVSDGGTVELGGTVLTAHLTAGHTPGCTAWTTTVQEGGRSYDVVFFCSLRAPGRLTSETTAQMERSFQVVRQLPCDVPLGDHPAQYRMEEKYARLQGGNALAFVEPTGCMTEVEIQEAMFRAVRCGHAAPCRSGGRDRQSAGSHRARRLPGLRATSRSPSRPYGGLIRGRGRWRAAPTSRRGGLHA